MRHFYERTGGRRQPLRRRSPTPAARWSTSRASAASGTVFENDPDIGGRYSVLSHFGLVPAALAGVNIEAMLHGAQVAEQNCAQLGDAAPANSGLWLGVAIGELALPGPRQGDLRGGRARSRASASGSSS